MSANELRVGNYVFDSFSKPPYVLTRIDLDDFAVISNYYRSNHPHPYRPVLIDDIWAERLNLASPPWRVVSKNNYWYLLGFNLDIKVTYIHELQNLYFALTKKELF